jgi:hypothetical protein
MKYQKIDIVNIIFQQLKFYDTQIIFNVTQM